MKMMDWSMYLLSNISREFTIYAVDEKQSISCATVRGPLVVNQKIPPVNPRFITPVTIGYKQEYSRIHHNKSTYPTGARGPLVKQHVLNMPQELPFFKHSKLM